MQILERVAVVCCFALFSVTSNAAITASKTTVSSSTDAISAALQHTSLTPSHSTKVHVAVALSSAPSSKAPSSKESLTTGVEGELSERLLADPISPFIEANTQSICDPCSAASFCLNFGTDACSAYSIAAKRGKGMEALIGGGVFGVGGLVLGVMLGAALGYIVGVGYANQGQLGNADLFSPAATLTGTTLAILFSIPFGILFGASGTVWGLQQGPGLFDLMDSVESEETSSSDETLPPPPGKQRMQSMRMSF